MKTHDDKMNEMVANRVRITELNRVLENKLPAPLVAHHCPFQKAVRDCIRREKQKAYAQPLNYCSSLPVNALV